MLCIYITYVSYHIDQVDSDDTMLSGDEEDEHYEQILNQLNDGTHKVFQRGGYRCPFDVKVLDTAYISLLQHADGRSKAGQRSPRDRAQHKALAEYLRNLD